jgi:hypothetical protein
LRLPRNTLYPQKLALTSPTSGGCTVDIVRLGVQFEEVRFGISLLCDSESDAEQNASILNSWEFVINEDFYFFWKEVVVAGHFNIRVVCSKN